MSFIYWQGHPDNCKPIKSSLRFQQNGSNGIGHPHVAPSTHRAWDVRKVLEKALAEHRNPNPTFRGVNYDGLIVRYTQDPEPTVEIA